MFWKNKNKEITAMSSSFIYDSYSLTDTGMVRKQNEDSISVVRNVDGQGGMLAIVADGMGGHAGGEVASKMAVEIITTYVRKSKKVNKDTLKNAVSFANKAIYEKAKENSRLHGMGTTIVLMYVSGLNVLWANVGDSRLYNNQSDSISQISVDDVFQSSDTGKNHILTQACGTKPQVDVHTGSLQIHQESLPQHFLLCSDGLYDLVNDLELRKILMLENLSFSTELMMGLAKERGGHDNISIVNIEVSASLPEKTTQEIKIQS